MKKITAACLLAMFMAIAARADIIYFKDGLKTICQERAWEEGDRVKCEYGGYVIDYRKSDVLRILRTTPPEPAPKPKSKPAVVKKSVPNQRAKPNSPQPETGGLEFYDPRRPQKYWTSKNSKHENYNDAVRALAKQYNRSPDWIKANMGDTNDLAQIHRNLAGPEPESNSEPKTNAPSTAKAGPSQRPKQPNIEFYNPRRPSPYWTSADAQHKSFKDAIQAFAKAYNRSPQWIRENMGETNDLSEIHSNLHNRKSKETAE